MQNFVFSAQCVGKGAKTTPGLRVTTESNRVVLENRLRITIHGKSQQQPNDVMPHGAPGFTMARHPGSPVTMVRPYNRCRLAFVLFAQPTCQAATVVSTPHRGQRCRGDCAQLSGGCGVSPGIGRQELMTEPDLQDVCVDELLSFASSRNTALQ